MPPGPHEARPDDRLRIELWCAIAHQRISRFRVRFAPRNDGGESCANAFPPCANCPSCTFPLAPSGKSQRSSTRLAATRGALRDRHGRWKRDAMDAQRHETSDAMRTAKSCGPDAPRLALRFREMTRGNGDNKAWSPGRSRISRKTIAQGMPVAPAEPVVLPRAFLLHADHGCERHPVFPAPSSSNEGGLLAKLGRTAPRE